ncbi:tetratricopeptide repeat protein [Ancylothrix sp. C2]|uniref:tetratricopeptide repeat protein n=1 Tax=Ancylothrix sp. D3o TaxID=2953691 RepID=UPI0021BB7230|nr:tetratricopeptide repeat protein [Ancylothrix sp. D3o]MCT7951095.1 tetratricopeptide repeat protein [Ancylothrix sp. D3o]
MSLAPPLIITGLLIALIAVLDFTIFRHHRLGFKYIPGLKLYNKAVEQTKQRNYTSAIGTFTQALQQNPNLIEAYNRRGHARFLAGDTSGAIKDYNQAITLNPSYIEAYINRAYAHNKQGNRTAAIHDYNQATKLYLKQKDPINYRKTLETLKLLPKGEQTNKPIEEKPIPKTPPISNATNNNFEFDHGLYSAQIGDYKGAIQYFNQALKINSQDSIIYYNRGLAYFKLGKNKEALADLTKAIKINPNYIEALLARGDLYRKLPSYQQAIEEYTKVIEINPENAQAYYNRALTYSERSEKSWSLQDKRQAQENYQKAAKLFFEMGDIPNYEKARKHIQQNSPAQPSNLPKSHKLSPSISPQKSKTNPNQFQRQKTKISPRIELEKKLLMLLNGERRTALRLVESAQAKYPDKTIDWYYEKVIWDIERDRGR